MTESATLDFPPIVETAQSSSEIAVAPKSVVTIKEAAVAHLRSHEPTILALAERYRDVALPLDTPKGLAAGQAALTTERCMESAIAAAAAELSLPVEAVRDVVEEGVGA